MTKKTPWPLVEVCDIASSSKNSIVGGPFGSDLVSSDYVEEGVPVIRGVNMSQGRWVSGEYVYVSEEKAVSLSSNLARPGDLVFTQRGTLGQVALVADKPWTHYLVSQSQMKLTVNTFKASPLFLYYQFKSQVQQQYIRDHAISAGVPHTNLGILRKTPISLPPLEIQDRIAAILGSLDDKIELNRRMNETLEAMARAIFRSWFVDFDPVRIKARGGDPTAELGLSPEIAALFPDSFQGSDLGQIPEGWQPGSLASELEFIGGGTPSTARPEYWGGDIPWYSVVDAPIPGDVWVSRTSKTVTQEGIDNSSTRILPENTVIISARGTVGKLAMAAVPMAMNQSCYGLRGLRSKGNFWTYFQVKQLVGDLQDRSHGSVFDTITRSTFDQSLIVKPSTELIERFDSEVSSYFRLIKSNLFESRYLAETRDYLLPLLLSGKVAVGNGGPP